MRALESELLQYPGGYRLDAEELDDLTECVLQPCMGLVSNRRELYEACQYVQYRIRQKFCGTPPPVAHAVSHGARGAA